MSEPTSKTDAAKLGAELAEDLSAEARILREQIAALQAEVERLTEENKAIACKVLGWAHTDACLSLDEGVDPRSTNVPNLMRRMEVDLELKEGEDE